MGINYIIRPSRPVHQTVCPFLTKMSQWPIIRSVVAERSSALDSSSGVVRMWVRIAIWPVTVLVSLSKTLNHNCFVLQMGRKAVGPVCCVMHVKEPRRRGLPRCFWIRALSTQQGGYVHATNLLYYYYHLPVASPPTLISHGRCKLVELLQAVQLSQGVRRCLEDQVVKRDELSRRSSYF